MTYMHIFLIGIRKPFNNKTYLTYIGSSARFQKGKKKHSPSSKIYIVESSAPNPIKPKSTISTLLTS